MKRLRLGTSLFLAIALTVINISTALAAAPVQPNVTSSLPNGSYKAGQVVPVQVVFPFVVYVTGTPQLKLSTGNPPTTNVNYSSGSGTNTLVFNYTVAAGNRSADLDYATDHSLALNGGTIIDAAKHNVNFKLAPPGTAGSLGANKNIVIDTTPPFFSAVAPVPNSVINSITTSSDVGYTMSETIASGSITMTQTGGAPTDTGSPHVCNLTGTALSGGTHNNLDLSNTTNGCTVAQSLVNGAVYSFAFSGIDVAGNPAVTVTNTGITFDKTPPTASWSIPPPCGSSPCMYTVANQPYQLAADASDNVGISMVVFKRYDYVNHTRVELGRVTSPPYTITFDTSQLLPSNNEIDAIAFDAANNSTWIFIFLNHSPIWQTYLPLIKR